MPHPDMTVVDVPLTVGQVKDLLAMIEGDVATGRVDTETARGPALSLYGALPADESHMRPGSQHWTVSG